MKKLYVFGMVLALATCFAYASSLAVPWFVDNAPTQTKLVTLATNKTVGLIYLHNNLDAELTCSIEYYSQEGVFLGPVAPDPTTFVVPNLSTVAFRPVADDPISAGGMEAAVAAAIPNRPTTDGMKNGAIVIRWVGDGTDLQGIVLQTSNVDGGATGRALQWGTLLPSGV